MNPSDLALPPNSTDNPQVKWPLKIGYLVLLIAGLFIFLNAGLAWVFTNTLTKPGCPAHQPLSGGYPFQEYWLQTLDGLAIRIWYYPSHNEAAIITLGGLKGSLGNHIPPVDSLLKAGYGIIQVDTRACSQPSARVTLGADEIFDAEAALSFLQTIPEVDPNRIGVMGFSMGGATAIRLMARQEAISSLVRDGGYSSLQELFKPTENDSFLATIFRRFVEKMFVWQTEIDPKHISPIDDLQTIKGRPVLFIFGEMEAESGLAQYEAANEPKEVWIVQGGSHGNNHLVAPEEYQEKVLNFFNRTLLSDIER